MVVPTTGYNLSISQNMQCIFALESNLDLISNAVANDANIQSYIHIFCDEINDQ